LTNLRKLFLQNNRLTNKDVAWLRNKLPSCYICADYQDPD
jgi:hypothetical protein